MPVVATGVNAMLVPLGTSPPTIWLRVTVVAVSAWTVVLLRIFVPLTDIPGTMAAVEAKCRVVPDGVSRLVTSTVGEIKDADPMICPGGWLSALLNDKSKAVICSPPRAVK